MSPHTVAPMISSIKVIVLSQFSFYKSYTICFGFAVSYAVYILHTYVLTPTKTCFIMQEPEVSLIFVNM